MSKPTISILTGSESLGLIYKEQNQINVKFWDANLPFSDTTGRVSLNVLGKTRIILIQGAMDGEGFVGSTTDEKLKDFVYKMEVWINYNGEQQTATYTSSLGNIYTVDAVDWQFTRSRTDPNRLIYNLIMKEA